MIFLVILATDLQLLQWWTEHFVTALTQSAPKMPYGMRYIARETLLALKVRILCTYPKRLPQLC